MAITSFQFPGVELHQEWITSPALFEPQLGVAIIGEAEGTTTAPELALGQITSVGDITSKLGELVLEETDSQTEETTLRVNKMAMACYQAFSASNGTPVYFVKIKATASADFTNAMKFLEKFPYIYSIVPVTSTTAIIKDCIAQAAAESNGAESKIRRVVWCGVSGTTVSAVTTAKNAIAAEGAASSYRANVVWSPGALYPYAADTDIVIPPECLAAAPAGMRSYEAPHRPISNLGYTGFVVKDTTSLTADDLATIGSHGVWVITNNFDGVPVNKRQVTAFANNNLNQDEESNVANVDSIAMTLCRIGEDIVGCSNITPALIKALSDTISGVMDRYLINVTGNVYVGPQLISWNLDDIYQDPQALDHVVAIITCEPPRPFNRFVIYVRVV